MRTSFGARLSTIKGFNGVVSAPRINASHPLASRISFAVDMATGRELTGRGGLTVTGGKMMQNTLIGPARGCGTTKGAANSDRVTASWGSPTETAQSYFMVFIPNALGTNGAGTLFAKTVDGTPNYSAFARIYTATNSKYYIAYNRYTTSADMGSIRLPLGGATDILGRPYAVAVSDNGTANSARGYINGQAIPVESSGLSVITADSTFNNYVFGNVGAANRSWDGWIGIIVGFDRYQLTPAEGIDLTANPAALISGAQYFPFMVPAVSIYRPGSDITASGWTASTGSNLYDCINETTLDRGDYITSPNIPGAGAYVGGLDASVPAGTWDVDVDGKWLGGAAQFRIRLKDSGGTDVGVSSWQSATSSDATYTLTITTTGVATRFSIEVQ